MLVEDVFLAAHCLVDPMAYRFIGVTVLPMAWSDNIFVVSTSTTRAAKALAALTDQLESQHLRAKEDSGVIVPASTRKLVWRPIRVGLHTFDVAAETRSLGYHLACSGDTSRNRATMLGGLRGRLHKLNTEFSRVSSLVRGHWWKLQFGGILGFHAGFIGCSKKVFQDLGVNSNKAARKVASLPPHHNCNLDSVKSHFGICVQDFFARCVVNMSDTVLDMMITP